MNSLRRKPGLTRTSSLHLDYRKYNLDIADANGYYKVLGLADDRGVFNVSHGQIAKAYRDRMRETRTPTGKILDYRTYEMIGCAWNCLGNPESRAEYDRLKPPDVWIDHLVLREARRKAAARIKQEGGIELPRLKQAESSDPVSPPDGFEEKRFSYYVEPDVDVEYAFASNWMDYIARALHALGIDEDVRVGFTEDLVWRTQEEPWGRVFVIPVSMDPTFEKAAFIVSHVHHQPHWTQAYLRIVGGRT